MKSLLNLKFQLAILAIVLCTLTVNSQNNTESNLSSYEQTLVLQPTNFFVSPNVRDLPVCDDLTTFDGKFVPRDGVNQGHEMSAKRKRKLAYLQSGGESDIQMDPLAQGNTEALHRTATRAPLVSFEAIGIDVSPPDPSMAVGPNHVVTMENGLWAVYDKNGVIAPGFPKTLDDPLSGPNHSDNAGDPVVMYDREADRWFISQFQLSGNPATSDNVFLVGISTTPDPTGSYNIYEYELAAGNDYPHYGVWGDSYVTAGNFTGSQKVYTFNRTKMLAGDATAEIVGFSPANLQGAGFTAPIPVHSEGAGDATGPIKIVFYQDNAFPGIATDHIGLWNIEMNWTNATGTISNKIEIPTTAFDALIAGTGGDAFANLQQPGTTQRLDAIVGAVMNMSHWYKFPTHESILLNWVVEIGDGSQISGIRWVELRSTDAGANWTVFQEGTFTDPTGNESVFMGCISMDAEGNIGLGYTKTGNTTFPSLYYTGRMDGDPLGTMTVAEDLVIEGTTAVTNSRYGDYGQGVRDPEDDLTFWVTSEYSGAPDKRVRVYSFKLEPEIVLEIFCPNDITVACGADTTPASTGMATATSGCDADPNITFMDEVEQTCGNTQIITRTWTATDSCASPIPSCVQTITVTDTEPPTVSCPENITVFNDANECTAIVVYDAVTGSDTCGDVTITQTNGLPSGSAFPIGDTINEFEIEDDCGNITECSFTVTVNNTEIPEAICQNITVELGPDGTVTITAADVNGGGGTVCESENATIDIDTFDCSNLGENDVILTVVDGNGNQDACIATVTVEDVTPPMPICQNIELEINEDGDPIVISPDMIDNDSTDNCAIASYDLNITTFDCNNLGDNEVILTITDTSGNEASCTATVTIIAPTALPEASCQNVTVVLDADGIATILPENVASNNSNDICGNTLSLDIDTFTCDDAGEIIPVTLTVTNATGESASCIANVFVVDNLTPTITCPEETLVIAELTPYTLIDFVDNGTVTIQDNCMDQLVITQEPAAGTLVEEGETEIIITVTDPSGNAVSCDFDIFVDPTLSNSTSEILKAITLFPNPTDSYFSLSNFDNLTIEEITILDITGRKVKSFGISEIQENKFFVNDIASASYFVIVKTNLGLHNEQLIKK